MYLFVNGPGLNNLEITLSLNILLLFVKPSDTFSQKYVTAKYFSMSHNESEVMNHGAVSLHQYM